MEKIINELLNIEQKAQEKLNAAQKLADEMVAAAKEDCVKRDAALKEKTAEQIALIEERQKAQSDALCEADNRKHFAEMTTLEKAFSDKSALIRDELFAAVIG